MDRLADEIRDRWLRQNERVFEATGKMMEKYNVMDTTLIAGGGEYPNQDGFGWSNGVALAFQKGTDISYSEKIITLLSGRSLNPEFQCRPTLQNF
jgi:neutral trehalase